MRLALAFGVTVFLMIVVAGFAVNRVDYLSGLTAKLYRHPFAVTNAIYRADGNIVRMHRSMKDVALSKTPEDLDKAVTAVGAAETKVFDDLAVLKERFLGKAEMVDRLNKAVSDWKPIRERVIALMKEDKRDEAVAITRSEGAKQVAEIGEAVKALAEFSTEKADSFARSAEEARTSAINSLLALAFLAIVASAVSAALNHPQYFAHAGRRAGDGGAGGKADRRWRFDPCAGFAAGG